MSLPASIQFQDYQFKIATSTGVWRWTTRLDVSGASPTFEVRDIFAPFGLLRDTIPIPGPVVEAMKASIDDVRAAFPPTILIGPPASLTFNVDEGRGFSDPVSVAITNSGNFGSLLSAALTSSASYVSVTPATVSGVPANASGSIAVSVDSTSLLAANSPYSETITAQDANATNTPQTLAVTVNVRPKATIDLDLAQLLFTVAKPLSGAFPPIPSQQFVVENTGPAGSVLGYQIQRLTNLSSWLSSFAPVSGSLGSGQTATITVAVAPASTMQPGVYEETLRVSGYSTNTFVDILVRLTIT